MPDQPTRQPIISAGRLLPRYDRPRELVTVMPPAPAPVIPASRARTMIETSALSAGSKQLAHGLLRLARPAHFPGGGIGIEYGSLLKTAARPDFLAPHIAEAGAHLRDQGVDVLIVPGMSGYPIGAMYAIVAGLPALLLKKGKLREGDQAAYPAGAFVIPSYTGDGDVVMSADPLAAQDIVDEIAAAQLERQADAAEVHLVLRAAGADDIIDKAVMSQAVGESTVIIGEAALADFIARHRIRTGDTRPFSTQVEVVAWVTPLIKTYNQPEVLLQRLFGIVPFAGLSITSVQIDPPAIGIGGVGVLATSE